MGILIKFPTFPGCKRSNLEKENISKGNFFANSWGGGRGNIRPLEEIGFSAAFLHRRPLLLRHQAKCFDETRERKEGEGKRQRKKGGEKKGNESWWKSMETLLLPPSYRPPNYFRLVNAIFLKARAYICVAFKNTSGSGI